MPTRFSFQKDDLFHRLIGLAILLVLAWCPNVPADEAATLPFVLNPVSRTGGHAGTVMASPGFVQSSASQPIQLPQPLENVPLDPIPAGSRPTMQWPQQMQTPTAMQKRMPANMQIYVGPDGKTYYSYPNYGYVPGRAYQVVPNQNGPRYAKTQRPKIDYSQAPIQPAMPPNYVTRRPQAPVPQPTRIVSGAPLLNQKGMVSADAPRKQPPKPKAKSPALGARQPIVAATQNSSWLSNVRRIFGGRKASQDTCPNCGKPKRTQARLATQPNRTKQR